MVSMAAANRIGEEEDYNKDNTVSLHVLYI